LIKRGVGGDLGAIERQHGQVDEPGGVAELQALDE